MQPPISIREEGLLSVRIDRDGASVLVRASGEIDLASAGMLEEELGRAFTLDASVIVLDLREVDFIDTTGLRVLRWAGNRSREDYDRLSMWLGSGAVRQLVEVCGLEAELPLTD